MGRLIKYELYKIFSKKSIIIVETLFLALVLLVSISSVNSYKNSYGDSEQFYNQFYKGKEGVVTKSQFEEAEKFISNQNNSKIYDKQTLYGLSDYYNNVNKAYYDRGLQKAVKKDSDAITSERLKAYGKNSYEYKYAVLHSDILNKQQPIGVYYNGMWPDIFNNINFLLVATLIILAISPIFSSEYGSKTDSIILSSKKGRGSIITAKIIVSAIFSVGISCVFSLVGVLSTCILGGDTGFDKLYIHNIEQDLFTNTCLEYFITTTLYMIFGALCLAFFVVLISAISKNQLVSFFASALIFAIPMVYSWMEGSIHFTEKLKHTLNSIFSFSYYGLLKPDNLLSEFKAYNIFGNPVLACIVVPFTFLLLTVVLSFFIYPAFKKHQVK